MIKYPRPHYPTKSPLILRAIVGHCDTDGFGKMLKNLVKRDGNRATT